MSDSRSIATPNGPIVIRGPKEYLDQIKFVPLPDMPAEDELEDALIWAARENKEALRLWLADGWLEQDFEAKGMMYRLDVSAARVRSVFVVTFHNADGNGLEAVFRTKESAKEFVRITKKTEKHSWFKIKEMVLQ